MEVFLQLLVTGILVGSLYSLVAFGFVAVYKSTQVFNFAQAGILPIGAYLMYQFLVPFNLPLWAAFLLTILFCAGIGLLAERVLMRPLVGQPILASVVVTLALMVLFRAVTFFVWGGETVSMGESLLPTGAWQVGFLSIPQIHLFAFIISMVLIGLLTLFFDRTRAGLGMKVTHEDHVLAQNLGIDVNRVFQYSWVIACVLGAVAGMLMGNIQGVNQDLDLNGLVAIAAVLFGGLESFLGALIAGLAIGLIQSLAIGYLPIGGEVSLMVPFIVLLLVLLFKPYGLFGLVRIERI